MMRLHFFLIASELTTGASGESSRLGDPSESDYKIGKAEIMKNAISYFR